ncbi:uncharacterized protein A4U43_C03F20910 [Asparagus officinalis]|uniref:RRM domain-containing protein n=1 Tax=Asparagus officinalis TaxID=4686 RepID=A0A5P1FGW2_ASPOF|nr:uncharacterized protein A4U43_C03F20910 [Asparagus officinalis]
MDQLTHESFKFYLLQKQIVTLFQFESARDADDAVRGRDGYNFDGYRLRVELAHGGRGRSSSSSFGRGSSYGSGGGSKYGISRRSEYRVYLKTLTHIVFAVVVRGLPPTASWQHL